MLHSEEGLIMTVGCFYYYSRRTQYIIIIILIIKAWKLRDKVGSLIGQTALSLTCSRIPMTEKEVQPQTWEQYSITGLIGI